MKQESLSHLSTALCTAIYDRYRLAIDQRRVLICLTEHDFVLDYDWLESFAIPIGAFLISCSFYCLFCFFMVFNSHCCCLSTATNWLSVSEMSLDSSTRSTRSSLTNEDGLAQLSTLQIPGFEEKNKEFLRLPLGRSAENVKRIKSVQDKFVNSQVRFPGSLGFVFSDERFAVFSRCSEKVEHWWEKAFWWKCVGKSPSNGRFSSSTIFWSMDVWWSTDER